VSIEQYLTPDPLPQIISPVSEHESSSKIESTVTEISLPKAKETLDLATKPEIKTPRDKAKEQSLAVDSVMSEVTKSELAKIPAVTSGFIRVKLLLTGISWVGVQDKNGKTVFSKLVQEGAEDYVEGLPPLKFNIGNASATKVIFNGETIDLAPSTINNIARITVGDH
jgi:cytoskeleton protein RodZ